MNFLVHLMNVLLPSLFQSIAPSPVRLIFYFMINLQLTVNMKTND